MRDPRGVRAAWVAALLASVWGCATPPPAGPLTISQHPYDRDVPVPVGFYLVDRSSEDWSGAATRYLRHRYRGRADKYAVRRFYDEQMPLVRWTEVSDGNIGGRITMRFTRGTESCTVTIEDGAGRNPHSVDVEVLITPSGP